MEKIVLVTGGSRGIGAATAVLAGSRGYSVVVNYRENQKAAEQVVAAIVEKGGKAFAIKADVSKENEIIRLFEEIDRKFGRLTALVNNAGILEKQGPVISFDAARLQRIFAVNSIGPMLCAKEAVKRMSVKSGGNGGAIVNVSSSATKQGGPFEYIDYAASKGAIDVLTLGLSKEVAAEGIRVNAVRPGIVYTEIHALGGEPDRVDRVKHNVPMQRGGNPEEIANAILWLLSAEASFCTGAILDVSGGR
jgi:NAD(P)-dependent dehydrogenase (short-subunit alcohol dehydrogenase family)